MSGAPMTPSVQRQDAPVQGSSFRGSRKWALEAVSSGIEAGSADTVGDEHVGTLISERFGLNPSGAGDLPQTVVWARSVFSTIESGENLRVGGHVQARVGTGPLIRVWLRLKTFTLRPCSVGRSLWRELDCRERE